MIYTYGDSFSYHFWITEEETYTHVLSQKLNVDYANKSFPALCHHETYQRLIDDLDSLQSGDLIVYQFTAGTREGYRINDIYYSSAGLTASLEDTNEMMDKWGGGRKKYPITDDGTKKSATGLLCVGLDDNLKITLYDKVSWKEEGQGLLKAIYINGEFHNKVTLSEIRELLK